jgi:hypothetical protein
MSYENPQAVIDTESAKYYANAISGIGKNVAKGISTRYAKAQAQRKANIKDQTDRMNDSSAYLKEVNKAIKGFRLPPAFREQLNDQVTKASDLRSKLKNINFTGKERGVAQNELNNLETFFTVGLSNALENYKGMRDDISNGQLTIGQEGKMSASANHPQLIQDVNTTFNPSKTSAYDFNIETNEDGIISVGLKFNNRPGGRGKVQTVLGEDGMANEFVDQSRNYNLNSDFGASSYITNPSINANFTKTLDDLEITKKGAVDGKSSVVKNMILQNEDGSYITKDLQVGSKIFEIPQLDRKDFETLALPSLKAQINGIMQAGRAETNNMALGQVNLQSWVDDVAQVDIDIESDPSGPGGITQESYDKLTKFIIDKKFDELQNGMEATNTRNVEDSTIKDTDAIRTDKYKKDQLEKSLTLLGEKLEKKVIPTFQSLDDPNVNNLITYIENLDGIKSVDFSKNLAKGDKPSFKVVGNGKAVTIDSGMSQAQIKKALLKAAGANDKQVSIFDFTKTDDKFSMGGKTRNIPSNPLNPLLN